MIAKDIWDIMSTRHKVFATVAAAMLAGTAINRTGAIIGELKKPTGSKKDIQKIVDSTKGWSDLIPGVNGYREGRLLAETHKRYGAKSPRLKAMSQTLGPATSMLLTALAGIGAGGLIGAAVTPGKPDGLILGAGIGGAVSSLGGFLVGDQGKWDARWNDPTIRTDKEQREASGNGNLMALINPYHAPYEKEKTLNKGHATVGDHDYDNQMRSSSRVLVF
jgi:hypothetical protein